jgi:hypothetical protein
VRKGSPAKASNSLGCALASSLAIYLALMCVPYLLPNGLFGALAFVYTYFAMNYVALAVLVAVMQASPAVPRKTADSVADSRQNEVREKVAQTSSPQNAQQPVRVSELPPVSVTKDWMDRTAWLFGLGLLIVGSCGVLAAYKTLRAIESQARIMAGQLNTMDGQLTAMKESGAQTDRLIEQAGKQAEATRANAAVLMNAERAWIMTQIRWSGEVTGMGDPTQTRVVQGTGADGDTLSIDICLTYQNDGKTPAWIMEKRILFRNVESLPVPPQFEWEVFGDYERIGPEPVTVGGDGKIRTILTCEGRRELGKSLVVYGFVKYRDVFSPERETRFGYVISPDNKFQRIAGEGDFWQYNSYT